MDNFLWIGMGGAIGAVLMYLFQLSKHSGLKARISEVEMQRRSAEEGLHSLREAHSALLESYAALDAKR